MKDLNLNSTIKLPSTNNAILIQWQDGLKNISIDTTDYLWDMLEVLGEEEKQLVFTAQRDKKILTITIDMEKVNG